MYLKKIINLRNKYISLYIYILFRSGACLILLIVIIYIGSYIWLGIQRKIKKKPIINLLAISYMNLREYGFCVNASGFIIGYGLLVYVFFNATSTTKSTFESGGI